MFNELALAAIARQKQEALAAEVRADQLSTKQRARSVINLSLFVIALFALTLLFISLPSS